MADEYRRKVRGLIEALNKEEGRAEAGQLIRSLIERIILVPEDKELEPEIVGDLAGILKLAASSPEGKPRRSRPIEIEQVKVVAGARNHLYLLFRTDSKRSEFGQSGACQLDTMSA